MNSITRFLPEEIVEALGWTFFHSIWQFAVIAVFLGVLLTVFGKFSSQFRYFVASSSYLFILAMAVFTFISNYERTNVIEQAPVAQIGVVHDDHEYANKPVSVPENSVEVSQNSFAHLLTVTMKSFFSQHFPVLVFIWLLGIFILSIRFLGNLAYIHRLKNYRTISVEQHWQQWMNSLAEKLGINKQVQVLKSSLARTPMVVGVFKPVILLPLSAISGISVPEMECIIAHELAHIKRNDYFINLLQKIIEILFFYHPAVWWISSVIKSERENCCDDIAISVTGDSVSLVKALATLEEKRLQSGLAVAFSGNNNKVLKRVQRLLKHRKMKSNFMEGFIASCVIFLSLIALAFTFSTEPHDHATPYQSKVNASLLPIDDTSSYNVLRSLEKPDTLKSKDEEKILKKRKIVEEQQEIVKKDKEQNNEYQYRYEIQRKQNLDQAYEQDRRSQEEAEMDVEIIIREAKEAANEALADMDVEVIVHDALAEAQRGLREAEIEKSVHEAIRAAQESLRELDLNVIINEAIQVAQESARDIDADEIVREVTIEIESAMNDLDIKMNTYSDSPIIEHKQILESGVENFNNWRLDNPDVVPNLMAADLSEMDLTDVNLEGAKLIGVNLSEADLTNANLSGAQMQGANLKEANIKGTSFIGADLRGAVLSEATISKANFKGAQANRNTQFPPGFNPDDEGVDYEN